MESISNFLSQIPGTMPFSTLPFSESFVVESVTHGDALVVF